MTTQSKRRKCPECGEVFVNYQALGGHMRKHNRNHKVATREPLTVSYNGQLVRIVAAIFPDGIQTVDEEQLLDDLRTLGEISAFVATLHERSGDAD